MTTTTPGRRTREFTRLERIIELGARGMVGLGILGGVICGLALLGLSTMGAGGLAQGSDSPRSQLLFVFGVLPLLGLAYLAAHLLCEFLLPNELDDPSDSLWLRVARLGGRLCLWFVVFGAFWAIWRVLA